MEADANSCIICAVTVPVITEHSDNDNCTENLPKFLFQKESRRLDLKLGLQLFFKLLQTNQGPAASSNPIFNYHDKDNEIVNCAGGPFCCDECWKGLEELLRLQQAFEEIQCSLFEQVEKLKIGLLTKSHKEKSTLNTIRDQLIACAQAENKLPLISSSSLSQGIPKTAAKYQREIQSCSVKLTRLSPSQLLPITQKIEIEEVISEWSDNDNVEYACEDELSNQLTNQEIKEPVKDQKTSRRKRRRKTDSNLKKTKYIPIEYFLRLSENLLLYKSSLIGVNYGEFLKCLEGSSTCDFISNGTDYQSFQKVKSHVQTTHLEEHSNSSAVRTCPKCEKEITNLENFEDHLLSCYGIQKIYICPSCWKLLKSKDGLKVHQWTHKSPEEKLNHERPPSKKDKIDPNKKYYCDYENCGKSFSLETYLRNHQITHLPKNVRKKFNCPHCPTIFLTAVAVRGHIEREHNKNLMRFRYCPICNKQYNWRNGNLFRDHVKSHTGENLNICEECGKSFMHKDSLKYHREMCHDKISVGGGKAYQCEFCEKRYSHYGGLTRHKKAAH